ncbi:hypothetical protein RRG08_019580 [Elysia crispata]|uniref:Uncharacterized protein n=1 Tax=Elysia crispata TaxID=231223 RepID=A0AAE1D3P3_9GAST|nr:hypothetical protein RRG08_019580 [Elysia crispata]
MTIGSSDLHIRKSRNRVVVRYVPQCWPSIQRVNLLVRSCSFWFRSRRRSKVVYIRRGLKKKNRNSDILGAVQMFWIALTD